MERHEFDGVSFFFGLIFMTLASWVLVTDGRLDFVDARWIWPVLLVVGGIALLIPAFRRTAGDAQPLDAVAGAQLADDPAVEAAKAELPPDPFGGGR